MTSDAAAARRIILGYEARLNVAGADRTKVKLELYDELRSKGLDEDAELLMTFDVITRANTVNPAPVARPATQPPGRQATHVPALGSQRAKRTWMAAVVLALLILLGMRLAPYLYTLFANHLSPVVVPNSHFVGEHGSKKKLLIFVHGVIGDMDNTWINPETHASWPQLITEDKDLSDFDVFVYGYASPAIGDASSIEQISVRFLQQLRDFGFFDNYNEVSFITHSMGGIVTKRTLNMLNTQADSRILQKVRTVIYISVPSNGANLAALASWISNNPQFKGMSPQNASDFLQSIEGDWASLLRQRSPSLPFPRTYSAYETVSTGPVQVVPEIYTSGLSDGRVVGFDYNHINIVKPKDRDAEVYRWVKARLLEKRNQSTERDAEREKNIKLRKPVPPAIVPTEQPHISEFRGFGDDALRENKIDDARANYKAALCLDEHEVGTSHELERLPPATDWYVYSLRTVGRKLSDSGEFRCAERLFREALNYASQDPTQTHYLLGLTLANESKTDEAISELKQSERLLPSPEPSCAFGDIYTWLGYLHRGLGWALRSKGRYDDALEEFNKARPCLGPSEWVPTNLNEVKSGNPQA